ncbi:hypothetical protein Sango_1166800 [Sesamum angolense]|uniref:RNase H type-1 domain-containing protein n=1 Tax=Sesamum angolense TaxID=2727404 RepID=A0AAE2BWQ4_9LAMI|nr:hypothetical protein Sango_1166800 [Sesamum angolense]
MMNKKKQKREGWKLHVDGASTSRCRAGILLQGPGGVGIEVAAKLDFPTTNNEVEYEALTISLRMALDAGVKQVDVYTDSQLVEMQIDGSYETGEWSMTWYLKKVWNTENIDLGQWGTILSQEDYRIVQGLKDPKRFHRCGKSRLEGANDSWVEELPGVLWSYWTTPRTATGETLFYLVYGSEVVILVEIGEETARVSQYDPEENHQAINFDLATIEKIQNKAFWQSSAEIS